MERFAERLMIKPRFLVPLAQLMPQRFLRVPGVWLEEHCAGVFGAGKSCRSLDHPVAQAYPIVLLVCPDKVWMRLPALLPTFD